MSLPTGAFGLDEFGVIGMLFCSRLFRSISMAVLAFTIAGFATSAAGGFVSPPVVLPPDHHGQSGSSGSPGSHNPVTDSGPSFGSDDSSSDHGPDSGLPSTPGTTIAPGINQPDDDSALPGNETVDFLTPQLDFVPECEVDCAASEGTIEGTDRVASVPEPGTLALLSAGLLSLCVLRRRQCS
jgi:PEP-CTERM motif